MSAPTLTRAQKVVAAAARIFGTHVGDGLQSGRKVLAKGLAGPKFADYYVKDLGKTDPLFQDPAEERRKIKLERLARRGKVTPKKGAGKRASKGK
mmetsp:Transcript_35163/g.86270  ORF Transcript_35163/g.86270 Transcript_35163/m.86270 type:complete len:95 (-) Transcript_35163:919-1203(-)|eukprot:CAMPEP_0197617506 /NCGR_PEP_ID=MMETSP1326-20131121/61071_1 /TAXON_ID=1155430 /ORGANISM="Genus nov. species nov., Strain RCC2288" /LENGTH=94 /DNA_ID=CAMNT_0043186401 /DNA_START=284 /DNA_END=568 /DNA_ORIENTATION=+